LPLSTACTLATAIARHLAPRLFRGAADVRQQHRARCGAQAGMDRGLVGIDVEAGGAELSQLERGSERFFADQVPARCVDENRAPFHAREGLTVDDPLGLGARGHVQAEDVALGREPGRVDARGAGLALELGLRRARRVQETQPKRHRTPPNGLADPPCPEQPKGPAAQLEAQQLFGVPTAPVPAAHQVHTFDESTRGREDQRPGEIGSRIRQHPWRVGDGHLSHLGGDEIDVVVTDRDIRDDAKIGKVLEFGSTNPARQQRHDRHPVALWRGFRGGQPCDIEVCKLRGLNEILDLGSDQNSVGQSTFSPLGPTYSDCGRIR
jgi:hypothetical protein